MRTGCMTWEGTSANVQLLEKWGLCGCAAHNDELARANWFWNRRPRLLQTTSCIVSIIVALGLPLRLFIFPAIGVPLLILAAEIVNTEIVRSARWRRQYELSIDRLSRTSRVSVSRTGRWSRISQGEFVLAGPGNAEGNALGHGTSVFPEVDFQMWFVLQRVVEHELA